MIEEKYTIHLDVSERFGGLIVGDLFNIINGDIIIGSYCIWPKTEPRYFKIMASEDKCFIDSKVIFNKPDGKVKFYQKLNRNKW